MEKEERLKPVVVLDQIGRLQLRRMTYLESVLLPLVLAENMLVNGNSIDEYTYLLSPNRR